MKPGEDKRYECYACSINNKMRLLLCKKVIFFYYREKDKASLEKVIESYKI